MQKNVNAFFGGGKAVLSWVCVDFFASGCSGVLWVTSVWWHLPHPGHAGGTQGGRGQAGTSWGGTE